jgi:hypothetical protein
MTPVVRPVNEGRRLPCHQCLRGRRHVVAHWPHTRAYACKISRVSPRDTSSSRGNLSLLMRAPYLPLRVAGGQARIPDALFSPYRCTSRADGYAAHGEHSPPARWSGVTTSVPSASLQMGRQFVTRQHPSYSGSGQLRTRPSGGLIGVIDSPKTAKGGIL